MPVDLVSTGGPVRERTRSTGADTRVRAVHFLGGRRWDDPVKAFDSGTGPTPGGNWRTGSTAIEAATT